MGKTLTGQVLSWNGGAERIFGYAASEMVGQSIRKLIPDDRQAEEDHILASIGSGKRVPHFETLRLRKDGSLVPVAVTVSPVLDAQGRVIAASKIARDVSHQRNILTQLEESERRFRLLADNISQLAWIADRSGAIFWYNRRWFDFTGTTMDQVAGFGWKVVHHPDHVERVAARYSECVERGEEWEDTFPLRGTDGEYRWFLSRAMPIRDANGHIQCWFGTNTDVTEMREKETRIELLLQEVNHRSKNLLAVVQSLARRSEVHREDFIERLEHRIRGLAANQDLLVHRAWTHVPVQEMVAAQLRFLGSSVSQCRLEGPEVLLSPGAAETLAMAVHEMAINAIKYGALSTPNGNVSVTWSLGGTGADAPFRMEWIERGGPRVITPGEQGFGSRIMIDVPRSKLRADVMVDYDPDGFRWTFVAPIKHIS